MNRSYESTIGEERTSKKGRWRRFLDWMAYNNDSNKDKLLKDMKNNLSLVASIITTMTFQLATNPPGGVFQADGGSSIHKVTKCGGNTSTVCSGEAVLAVVYNETYKKFFIANTVSFTASLSVCLLLMSGVNFNQRLPMWCLSIGMNIAVTSLASTYFFATAMVTPDTVFNDAMKMLDEFLILWFCLLGFVALLLVVRFLLKHVSKWTKKHNPNK